MTKENHKEKFEGLWRLIVAEHQDPETGSWEAWNGGLQGFLLYDNKDNVAVHMTPRGYQTTEIQFHLQPDNMTLEELKHRAQSYVYFAKYKINEQEKIVEHIRISHSSPLEWNLPVKRKYEFNDDTLTLTTLDNHGPKLRLKWIRD